MRKSLTILPLFLLTLGACNVTPTKVDTSFKIDEFYNDLERKNYTISDGELTQIFYNENALLYRVIDQVDTAVVKMRQGIFEIHKTENSFEPHGMLTPNTDLDLLDGCSNFHDISSIGKGQWKYDKESDTYTLKPTSFTYETLSYTGYFSAPDYSYIRDIVLSKTNKHEYKLDVHYKTSAKKEDYTITFTHYGENVNHELMEYISNTTLTPQTDWNSYQLSALETYGFSNVPYLSSFTLGFKMYFMNFSGYASGGYACMVYDCMSDASMVEGIGEELISLGFEKESNNRYTIDSETVGLKLSVTYAYISHEEIEVMVAHKEANKGDLLAYPNGYMQYLFAYSFAEVETDFTSLNDVMMNSMSLPSLVEESFISKVTSISYKESFNNVAVTDEDYLAMFNELGYEPGPLYEELSSYYFYIESEEDAISYIDKYLSKIDESYICTGDRDISISEETSRSKEFYMLEDDMVKYIVDVYLYDSSSSGDLLFPGVVEILITKYTELGAMFFSY